VRAFFFGYDVEIVISLPQAVMIFYLSDLFLLIIITITISIGCMAKIINIPTPASTDKEH